MTAVGVHRVAPGAMAERTVAILGEHLGAGPPSDTAVLARVNSALLPVQVALTESGIGHSAPLDRSVLNRTGVRTALAYLRLGLDLERIRRDDLFDTINRPARKVKSAVSPLLPRRDRMSFRQLEQLTESLDPTHRDRFRDYLGDLRGLEAAITDGADTARCLWIVRNRIGLGEAMDALDASRSRPEGSSHGDDLDALEQLATLRPDPATFRDWLIERLRVPADPRGVTLSTVHRVKGMEWPRVVVFAANQGLFPHRLSEDVEEERRVFHVALTRCRERVDVVADRARCSPFVDQLATARVVGDGSGGRAAADAATDPTTDGAGLPERAASFHPDGSLVAAVGVRLELPGGFTGRIAVTDRDQVAVRLDTSEAVSVRLGYGTVVRVAGDEVRLGARPRLDGGPHRAATASSSRDGRASDAGSSRLAGTDEAGAVDDALFEELRSWRSRIAGDSGVPAYLVFHDRHLQVMAGRKPRSLRELAGCPGVGPTKLERYGDDLLDLIAAHAP